MAQKPKKHLKNIALASLAALSVALGGVAGYAQNIDTAAPGTALADGTVYAGVANDHKLFATTKSDAPAQMSFAKARAYCEGLEEGGHSDWHLPTPSQLETMMKGKNAGALKGTFNLTGQWPQGWYWSSKPSHDLNARTGRWSAGYSYAEGELTSSVRCVRTIP